MIHICDVNNFFSFTGGGVRTYHLHKMEFFKTRPDVLYTLVIPDDHDAVVREGNIQKVHFPATPIPGADNYRYILDALRLRRVFVDIKPDIIEIGSPYIAPWVVKWAAAPTGATLCGFWHADYPRAYIKRYLSEVHPLVGDLGHELAWWYAGRTYGTYAATFAAADCVVSSLWERGIPRVFQTPLGVDVERFHPDHASDALRRSVNAEGRPLLFFPHRLIEEKGLSALLSAFPRIYEEHRPVLVFAGVGPGLDKLEAFMADNEDVHYLGYVDDPTTMASWYATADAIFALSAFETFGLSAAEAMASGTALIGADEGAVEEWVRRADCGELLPYNDVDALVDATGRLLTGDACRVKGDNARAFAEAHFSWQSAFERMLGFYRELVDTPDPFALPPEPRRWVT